MTKPNCVAIFAYKKIKAPAGARHHIKIIHIKRESDIPDQKLFQPEKKKNAGSFF